MLLLLFKGKGLSREGLCSHKVTKSQRAQSFFILSHAFPAETRKEYEKIFFTKVGTLTINMIIRSKKMNRFKMYFGIVLSFAVSSVMAADVKVSHPFICTDLGKKQVIKVDSSGKVVWSCPALKAHDVWVLKNGNILLASAVKGVQEVTPDKKVVWEYKVPKTEVIYSCQPLPNGDVLVGIGKGKGGKGKGGKGKGGKGSNKIVEVNREGAVTKTIELKTKGSIRLTRKTKSGNYIVAARSDKKVQVYDSAGKLIRDISVPGVYLAFELDNGNILVGCGDGHKVLEFDSNDKVVWQIDENELPGNPLRLIAGMQRLPNGNTVIANYGGHGHLGKQPQIFEVTRDKKVVWQFFDNDQLTTPAHVQLLDITGDAAAGELYR